MKAEKLRTCVMSALLSLVVSSGGVLCLVTAFSLPVYNFAAMLAIIAAVSALCALVLPRRGGEAAIVYLFAFAIGYMWYDGTLWEQTKALLDRLTYLYDCGYGWGRLELTQGNWENMDVQLPLTVLGCLSAFGIGRAVCRRGSLTLGLLPASLALALCLVVTDTVPDAGALLLYLAGTVTLLLSVQVRRESAGQGSRLAARAALPVTVLLALLLFVLVPQDNYVNCSAALREKFLLLLQDMPSQVQQTVSELSGGNTDSTSSVNLQSVGPQNEQTLPIMEVFTELGGTVYLRGRDYDTYTGLRWESTSDRTELYAGQGEPVERVAIRTLTGSLATMYIPCYPGTGVQLTGGRVENTDRSRVYEFTRCLAAAAGTADDAYLTLPEETAARARTILLEAALEKETAAATAAAIADYVRESAVYDRNTSAMPSGEDDFALWFLESAETGYCVHFATAAAVLLRAAGIPARYVTGYLATSTAGQWSTVTAAQAHAWTEYYNTEEGCWELLDATPADLSGEDGTASATEATREATEASTTAPSKAEATQGTSEPTYTTAPEEDSAGSEQTPQWLAALIWTLFWIALACAALVGQRLVRLELRHRRCSRGRINRRCLAKWQLAERMAHLLGEEPPEPLHDSAEKARFSQHTLRAEESAAFDSYLRSCADRLNHAPWPKRMLYKWVLAII